MSFAKCLQLCNHHPKADVECLCGPPKVPSWLCAANPLSCLHFLDSPDTLVPSLEHPVNGIIGWESFCI